MIQKSVQDTAILIFANSATQDSRIKKIGSDTTLFDALNQHSLKIVKATGLPYFHFTEKEQRGETFGERFTHAIQSIFDKGFANIIAIGNDSPQLKTQHLLETHQKLQLGKTVLGPAVDGGFYLLGLHASNFHKNSFEALPWQVTSLFNTTQYYFESLGCVVFSLSRLIDIDSASDIKRLSNHITTLVGGWLSFFSKLLHQFIKFIDIGLINTKNLFLFIPFNKGSPVSFA
ncbi:DUF2064 domain-containing protein [Muricauda sp. CAU 1633]|uniref:TIGR04282 family arsenosugar biosynthesis glycosyltransferase n=1 Tax=Allomuricauda sp. CAU 1633 TaxID=2816036 RepID=UPI001A8E87FA|nr:DUF2064 domain-containing protein [Muricauda sp. CAU 1633]MBO0320958.1 DUF2064 domain-containing protein [Muricauda sp. CAU 1633]